MALGEIVNENVDKIPSNGKVNAALATGIIGTAGLFLNGGLGNILGGGNGTNSNYVDKDQFYTTTMAQNDRTWGVIVDTQRTQAETNLAFCQRMSNLEASLAVANTANEYQNMISSMRADYESKNLQLGMDLAICNATRNVVRANPMISPNQIGVGYAADTRVLESYPAYHDPYRRGYGADGISCCG